MTRKGNNLINNTCLQVHYRDSEITFIIIIFAYIEIVQLYFL